jgi:hypothetical protein
MTKLILVTFAVFFTSFVSTGQNNIAGVNKIQGFYIFTDCQPLAEYDVIGEVTTTGHNDRDIKNSGAQYQPVRDYLIRAARQVNYTADGLMITLVNGGTDKAVIIKFKENVENKNQAKVKQFQGLYLFVDNEPLSKSKYLGTCKSKISLFSSQYTALRQKMIKKCKNDYKEAEGLILKFVSGGTDTGDAIKFED